MEVQNFVCVCVRIIETFASYLDIISECAHTHAISMEIRLFLTDYTRRDFLWFYRWKKREECQDERVGGRIKSLNLDENSIKLK